MLEDSFKKIADEAPSMLWVSDEKKKYIFFNKAWLEFRGSTMEKEVVYDWENAIYPQDLMKVKKKFEKSFADRKPYKIEYRLQRHDGSYRWIIESGIPQYNDMNQFTGFIGSCMDIHNIKELERRKDEFVTAASHELKTPLTSLTVYLHLIDEFFTNNKIEKYKAYSDGAIQQLNKITSLVDRFLDLNKIQSGNLSYIWSSFPLGDLLDNIIDKMRLMYPERKIAFSKKSVAHIWGDVERLSQAVENLLYNAIKYSDEPDEILVELYDDGSFVYLDVTDYGIGIEKAYQTKIFERFFRIPGRREQTYPGMGMGLYLTRKIIEKHNGKISVNSNKNEFTKFCIKIPLLNR